MWLNQILSFLGKFLGLFDQSGYSELYPGSSFNAITAAFATQGYWVHADMLHFIGAGEFQRFAVLIYMFALIGGIVGMAMGSPPKMYVWFFMGPVLFHFLLGSTLPVQGTAWKVAGVPQEQKEVWKLAEVGLKSSNIVIRNGYEINAFGPPTGSPPANECLSQYCPEGTVPVSMVFAIFDGVVSDSIQTLIRWLGVYDMGGSQGSSTTGELPAVGKNSSDISSAGRWHLLSNLKWNYLDTITQARLNSVELRDLFITFMTSDCGDGLQQALDSNRYAIASRSESGIIPAGVFKSPLSALDYATKPTDAYAELMSKLNRSIPRPIAIGRLLNGPTDEKGKVDESRSQGALRGALLDYNFGATSGGKKLTDVITSSTIQCGDLADIIVRGFRWEAAGVYAQLVSKLPSGVSDPKILDFSFLYGWDVRDYTPNAIFATGQNDKSSYRDMVWSDNSPKGLDPAAKQQFMLNLIFVNMMKNEFLLAPNLAARKLRFTSAQAAQNAIEMYQKTVGSRQKFGEIYSWAIMMPYLQGLVLYLLALGYPFACAVMLIPKSARILFTWASFWLWAKLWDLGFAIVVLLERSVWATIGSSQKATLLNPFIAQMSSYSKTAVTFDPNNGINTLKDLKFLDQAPYTGTLASYAFLDRAMTLFSNMDLDLQNSYYIYIMAALYFAVPMMTGQLVLGAKSGMAGAITGAFQNMAQEVGGRAGRALTQQMSRQAEAANQAVDQALYTKNLRNSELLARALNAQNESARAEIFQKALGAQEQGLGNQERMLSNAFNARQTDARYGFEFATTMLSNPANTAASLATLGIAAKTGVFDAFTGGGAASGTPTPPAGAGSNAGGSGPKTGAPTIGGGGRGISQNAPNLGAGGPTATAMNMGAIGGNEPQTGAPVTGAGIFGKMINPMTGAMIGGVGGGVDMAGKYWGYQLSKDSVDQTSALMAKRGDVGVASFYEGGQAQRLGREGQYLLNEAKGFAQDSAWFEKNSYAQGMAGELGSLDINLPQIGAKATDDSYLARSGLAGKEAQVESYYFSQSGPSKEAALGAPSDYEGRRFGSAVDSYRNSLQASFGTGSLLNIYNSRTSNSTEELRQGLNSMSGFVHQTFGDTKDGLTKLMGKVGNENWANASGLGDSVLKPVQSLMRLTSGNTSTGGSGAQYGGGRANLPAGLGTVTNVSSGNSQNKASGILEKR